ncbi:MAG TPA: type II toxin-antitoxin system RelE/ParE family toxin [Candidatus Babeliales bacterium]|jgi:phage-related protein|nr:type II toxin-antitoxin system RelE/ParE family toxin [Candidatus Babeliales bacterium]
MALKELIWVGSSYKDLMDLPVDIRHVMGYGLYLAQCGEMHESAKVLKGFGGAGVIEIIDSDDAGTYRAVYTIKMADAIFVLHVFQKKSKQGIKTPQRDIDLINARLKQAQEIYKSRQDNEKE